MSSVRLEAPFSGRSLLCGSESVWFRRASVPAFGYLAELRGGNASRFSVQLPGSGVGIRRQWWWICTAKTLTLSRERTGSVMRWQHLLGAGRVGAGGWSSST